MKKGAQALIEDRQKNGKKVLENVKEKLKKEESMKTSIKEGSAASVMSGFGDSYIAPFAIAVNANNAQIGFLTSITNLLAPFAQLLGSRLIEKYSRKKIVVKFVFFQALMWFVFIGLGFLFFKNIVPSLIPVAFIIAYVSYAIIGAFPGPAWFSWMGDIVPEDIRGKYFSRRNVICGVIALVGMLIAAFILDIFKTRGYVLFGFSILFFIAAVGRLFSSYYFTKQYEPKLKLKKDYYFSLLDFVKKAAFNNFGRFTIYVALIYLATSIAGPFFAVYMLKDLNFNYLTYTLVNLSSSIASLILMPLLGRFSDKFGNRTLLRIGGILVPVMPFLWIFSPSPYYIALVPQIVGGIGWAAFNLGVSNYIYDNVTPERRAICVSYFNIFVGIGVFLGASLGGLLAQYAYISFMNVFLFLFVLSGIFRVIFSLIFLPGLKENKNLKKRTFFSIIKEILPMRGIVYGIDGMRKHH